MSRAPGTQRAALRNGPLVRYSVTVGTLLAIDRTPFLIAVTGHDTARQAAWGVIQSMRPDDLPVAGPNLFVAPAEAD